MAAKKKALKKKVKASRNVKRPVAKLAAKKSAKKAKKPQPAKSAAAKAIALKAALKSRSSKAKVAAKVAGKSVKPGSPTVQAAKKPVTAPLAVRPASKGKSAPQVNKIPAKPAVAERRGSADVAKLAATKPEVAKPAIASAKPPVAIAKIAAPANAAPPVAAAQKPASIPFVRSQPLAAKLAVADAPANEKPAREPDAAAAKPARPAAQRHGFKMNEPVVYPAHGVGQIVAIEEQVVAGFKLELFVINFAKDKMTLRVPTSKVAGVGMRKLSEPEVAKRALDILTGRARVKRTMWSRRAQEYEAKINSGDINAIAEVVRDLYRSETQPEQSYSERQLYEAALDRIVREIAAVDKVSELEAVKVIEAQLQKGQKRAAKPEPGVETSEPEVEEAA